MKIVIAVHGTRGDVEPCAAVALELSRRGHDVRMAVPPNLVGFVESVGLGPAVPYGVDSQVQLEAEVFRKSWHVPNPVTELRQLRAYMSQGWSEMNTTLLALAEDADLILTGTTYEEVAANVAERLGIPLAALHYFPFRANAQIMPVPVPAWLPPLVWPSAEWLHWRLVKPAEDRQRHELGLPPARVRAIRRILDGGACEIQAYDPLFFAGLADRWAGRRPLIGSLTLQLDHETDVETDAWIADGTPPVYFGFGSMPVESPREAMATITAVCAELGERALVCSGAWDVDERYLPTVADHVRIVSTVNHTAVFPRCRAVVHHGGAGTTAAGLRAGAPTFVLWFGAEQPLWAEQIRRLKVGTAQRFSKATPGSIRDGLQTVLQPRYRHRAREIAALMTPPEASATAAADLVEAAALRGRVPIRQARR